MHEAGRTPPSVWVLVEDGLAGVENQCIGIAEQLGADPIVQRIRLNPPWPWLPARLHLGGLAMLADTHARPSPPWPDLIISGGRKAAGVAAAIRRRSKGTTRVVHLQDPHVPPRWFDLLVVPEHDGRAPSRRVMTTVGSLHRVTPDRLAAEAEVWRDRFSALPVPRVAVLIGGASRHHRFPPAEAAALADRLHALARETGAGLMVTCSRRTGEAAADAIAHRLADVPALVHRGPRDGPNPYFGMLGLADHVLVTDDSVSMVSEAVATGRPVQLLHLAGGSRRIDRFLDRVRSLDLARPYDGMLENWRPVPLDQTAAVAARIRPMLATSRQPS